MSLRAVRFSLPVRMLTSRWLLPVSLAAAALIFDAVDRENPFSVVKTGLLDEPDIAATAFACWRCALFHPHKAVCRRRADRIGCDRPRPHPGLPGRQGVLAGPGRTPVHPQHRDGARPAGHLCRKPTLAKRCRWSGVRSRDTPVQGHLRGSAGGGALLAVLRSRRDRGPRTVLGVHRREFGGGAQSVAPAAATGEPRPARRAFGGCASVGAASGDHRAHGAHDRSSGP